MNPYFLLGGLLASILAFGAGYYKGNEIGQAKIQQKWDAEKSDMLAKHVEEIDRVRNKERGWQQAADNIRQEKNREIRNLNARSTALINSLRIRPETPANTNSASEATSAGQATKGCTGDELYREHAEAFAGEAARADKIRAALNQCYAQYESVGGVLQPSE